MFPRQAIYKLLLRQGLINFARVGTAEHCLLQMFPTFLYSTSIYDWQKNCLPNVNLICICNSVDCHDNFNIRIIIMNVSY